MGQAMGQQMNIRTRTCGSTAISISTRERQITRHALCTLWCRLHRSMRTMKAALAPIAMPYALHAAWGKISPVVAQALRHAVVLSIWFQAPIDNTYSSNTNSLAPNARTTVTPRTCKKISTGGLVNESGGGSANRGYDQDCMWGSAHDGDHCWHQLVEENRERLRADMR